MVGGTRKSSQGESSHGGWSSLPFSVPRKDIGSNILATLFACYEATQLIKVQ